MTALRACTPHYIRCIKPNHSKKPNEWDNANIKRQVKYLGLLENVNVRRAGYAHRSAFDRFVNRYKLLCDSLWSGKTGMWYVINRHDALQVEPRLPNAKCCADRLAGTPTRSMLWGKPKSSSKVLLNIRIFMLLVDAAVLFHLEDLLDRKQNEAVIQVQKAWRSYKQKRERYFSASQV